MSRFPASLAVGAIVPNARLATAVESILSHLRPAAGPTAITIGFRGRPPRVQVFSGSAVEGDAERVRSLLKRADERYEVSLIRDAGQYSRYRTATAENPDGEITVRRPV